MKIRRLWLQNVGLFEIIPNSGNGSCLFQAISQALTFSTKHHHEIRTAIVNHMTSQKWTEKLDEFPQFWKHKIITSWLQREQSLLSQKRGHWKTSLRGVLRALCEKVFQRFIENRKTSKYRRIDRLFRLKNKFYPSHQEDFMFVFRKFMSQEHEPGTRFELEAGANKFRFHFDYLQTIPITSKSFHKNKLDLGGMDSMNESTEELKGNNNNEVEAACPNDFDGEEKRIKSISVKPAMYQFYSCRTCGCKLPQSCRTFEHFYFLHSPLKTWEDKNAIKRKNVDASGECWHWELLLPIMIRQNPVPLNRRIFGLSYEIAGSSRKFICTLGGQRREIPDEVAEAIDLFVQNNPNIFPPQDSVWPADDHDNFSGCAAAMEDPVLNVTLNSDEKRNT